MISNWLPLQKKMTRSANIIWICIRDAINWIVNFVFALIYDLSPRQNLPPIKNPILLKSASALAQLIRDREVICECLRGQGEIFFMVWYKLFYLSSKCTEIFIFSLTAFFFKINSIVIIFFLVSAYFSGCC